MSKRFGIILVIAIGLVFVGAGIMMAIFGSPAAKAEAARAERIPSVTAKTLEQQALGSEVLVEGRISNRNKTPFRTFVVYTRQEYRGDEDDDTTSDKYDRREIWQEDQHITPPLLLELADGPVQIANNDYQLQATPSQWQESENLNWNGFTSEGTKRYIGFKADDPALVIGTVADSNEGHTVRAEMLYGGNRAEYIAGHHGLAVVLLWMGVGFALLGSLCAALGFWLFAKNR